MIVDEIVERREAVELLRRRNRNASICFLRTYRDLRQEEGSSDLAALFDRGVEALEMTPWLMEQVRLAPMVPRVVLLYRLWMKTDDMDFLAFCEAAWAESQGKDT